MSTLTNYDPTIWGPHEWFMLETIVRALPDNLDEDLEKVVKRHFVTLIDLLPCEICQDHLAKYIEETKLHKLDFSQKIYVMTWLNNLHNRQRTIKKSLKDVNNYYDRIYSQNNTEYSDLLMIFALITICVLILKRLLDTQ